MTPLPDNPPPNQDDLLADFAERIRKGDVENFDFSADENLRSLEETLLRLHRAFPRETLKDETIKRLHADFGIRRRRQALQEKPPVKSWWGSLFRSPVVMTISAAVMIIILAIFIPSFTGLGSPLSASAGAQAMPFGLLAVFGIVVLLFLIFSLRRRK